MLKLLGLLALALPLGFSTAQASTFTYDVDYSFGAFSLTGDIVLNCDNCLLTPSSVVSWSLGADTSGGGVSIDGTNLSASPSGITFTPTASAITVFDGPINQYFFGQGDTGGSSPCTVTSDSTYGICRFGALIAQSTASAPLVIATADVPATPLPAALPLFAGGLGFVGYLTRRRKRSDKQALAAI